MKAAWASVYKEWLVLLRDKGGLGILFLMPMMLVVIMAIVQDAPFRDYQQQDIPILIVDNDHGSVSESLKRMVGSGRSFNLVDSLNGSLLDSSELSKAINSGDFQIGIIIHQGLSSDLEKIVDGQIDGIMASLTNGESPSHENPDIGPYISLVVDPTTKSTFRNNIRSAIKQFLTQLETTMLLEELQNRLSEMTGKQTSIQLARGGIVKLRETSATSRLLSSDVAGNSTQHNVPAWTVFAMFFIVIPLAGNMVRERNAGTVMRLRSMPASITNYYVGKLLGYAMVALIQALLMISLGFWLLPMFGLARLDIGSGIVPLMYVSVTVGLSATSYALLVGTIFKTHYQAATFGMVSVVIMAALGGIWVPLYIMSGTMVTIGHLSPMNWGLETFNSVFLRGEDLVSIIMDSGKLWTFTVICFISALLVELRNR